MSGVGYHLEELDSDIRANTLALLSLTSIIEWVLVRDKKRLGDKDVTEKLKEIDLVKALLSDDVA